MLAGWWRWMRGYSTVCARGGWKRTVRLPAVRRAKRFSYALLLSEQPTGTP